ncbi:GNAT family N-acetyltransferase [Sporolactobacillus kofuensis]|uniref:GNAT family N-acetyltransferase n=1 Tax=Sporolactobacillus kofuensis TaxID=269672 RepID=A0ABW1WE04_9BACL|nr:GNAT family N-acetyltransferase [Sporolactobacillus kofuensis]MCO7175362.1 GNAT family N-acetyltransferase [Sporolactobacillus kofuensis]
MVKDQLNFVIREAKRSDAGSIIAYLKRIAGESNFLTFGSVDELNLTVEKEERLLEELLTRNNAQYLIAECSGQIVGSLNFNGGSKQRTVHTGEFGISVLKEYWGHGIGRALIERMLKWSKENGIIRKINLRARSDNARAIHLYKSLGFVHEGVITRDLQIDRTFYDSVHMGLMID